MLRTRLPLIALLLVAGCVSAPPPPKPAPVPTPAPAPRPTPAPAPPPATRASDWQDWPVTPGDWAYRRDQRGSLALFGPVGAGAVFMIRCDSGARRIFLSRAGTVGPGGAQMTIRTSTQASTHLVRSSGGEPAYAALEVAPRDPLLDRIAFSRGRFVVQLAGTADLVIPAWPELTRVVEDCR